MATLSGIKHEVGVLQDMSWRRPAQIDACLRACDHHPLEHEGGATGANGLVWGDLASRDGTPRVVPIGFHWNGEEIVLATFDQQLWEAAKRSGLKAWPDQLPGETSEPEEPPE